LVARELNAKKLELLHELLPTAAGIGVFLNPSNPSIETFTSEVMEAALDVLARGKPDGSGDVSGDGSRIRPRAESQFTVSRFSQRMARL
jgi:hypothetical protein